MSALKNFKVALGMCVSLGYWRYLIPVPGLGRTTESFINTNKNKILQLIIFLIHGVKLKTYIKNMPEAIQDGDKKCVGGCTACLWQSPTLKFLFNLYNIRG